MDLKNKFWAESNNNFASKLGALRFRENRSDQKNT